jgi:hypothetical protein
MRCSWGTTLLLLLQATLGLGRYNFNIAVPDLQLEKDNDIPQPWADHLPESATWQLIAGTPVATGLEFDSHGDIKLRLTLNLVSSALFIVSLSGPGLGYNNITMESDLAIIGLLLSDTPSAGIQHSVYCDSQEDYHELVIRSTSQQPSVIQVLEITWQQLTDDYPPLPFPLPLTATSSINLDATFVDALAFGRAYDTSVVTVDNEDTLRFVKAAASDDSSNPAVQWSMLTPVHIESGIGFCVSHAIGTVATFSMLDGVGEAEYEANTAEDHTCRYIRPTPSLAKRNRSPWHVHVTSASVGTTFARLRFQSLAVPPTHTPTPTTSPTPTPTPTTTPTSPTTTSESTPTTSTTPTTTAAPGLQCPAGTYVDVLTVELTVLLGVQDSIGPARCVACPPGTVSPQLNSNAQCSSCRAGYKPSANQGECLRDNRSSGSLARLSLTLLASVGLARYMIG